MKKYGFMICALLALCFNACQTRFEEDFFSGPDQSVLTATIGSEGETKSSLSPSEEGVYGITWSDDDVIGVFIDGAAKPMPFTLTGGSGSKTATFSGYGSGDSYVGFYPFSSVESLEGETVRISLPAEQDYARGSFGIGAYPMVAVSPSDELPFKAVASIFRLSLTGHHTVNRIVFRSNDPAVKVCGPATVSLSNTEAPVLSMSSEGLDSLVLNIGEVILDSDEATDFCFVLPPQDYKGGFSVRVYTSTGYMDKKYPSDFRMERSRVHSANTIKVKLTSGVETSSGLAGNGSAKDPFLVSSLEDLMLVREAVNTEAGVIKGSDGIAVEARNAHYLLTTDLDLSRMCGKESGKDWVPVGRVIQWGGRGFEGTFDGGGHVVSNLYSGGGENGMWTGFFGYIEKATVRNLTVVGEVTGGIYTGLLAGEALSCTVENCVTKGRVTGMSYYGGGLMGMVSSSEVSYCINEADVIGDKYSGGLMGYSNFGNYVLYCTNKGNVSCSGDEVGGLSGYMDAAKHINCINYGSVEGSSCVGGIGGHLRQGAKVFNSVNYGDVKGKEFVGGIAGFVSNYATSYQGAGTVANCINLAGVSMTTGRYAGMIAGYLGMEEEYTPIEGEPLEYAWAKNCYWLAGRGTYSAAGGGPGESEGNFQLTDAQMKGAPYDGVLYTASNGASFNLLIDALNAGAFEWSKNRNAIQGGDKRERFPLAGWFYPSSGSYPAHSDLEAQIPGKEEPVFELSDKEFEFIVKGGEFQVEVTSSHDYSVASKPSWVSTGAVKQDANRPHTHRHSFTVAANNTGAERSGVIEFTNSEGMSRKVKVKQKAPYLTISATEFSVSSAGGSRRISIKSSIDWTADAESDWFRLTPASGSGDGAVSVIVDRNSLSVARSGSFEIAAADGSVRYTVSLIQSGNTGEGVGNWEELPFYHQSLVFRFTATWCTWCPYMNKAILRAQELYPDKIQQLALHCGGSDLQFDPAQTLMGTFKSNAYPTGIVDGRIHVNNGVETDEYALEYIAAVRETEEVYGTSSGLALSSVSSGQRVTVNVDAYFKVAGDYKVTVLLLEDGVVHYQENGGKDYVHDNLVRAAATDILGEPFRISRDLSHRAFSFTATVPDGCDMDNMRVFAYIQKSFGRAERIQTEDYGDYYVDNCATAPLGGTLKLRLVGDDGGGGGGESGNEEISTGDEIR